MWYCLLCCTRVVLTFKSVDETLVSVTIQKEAIQQYFHVKTLDSSPTFTHYIPSIMNFVVSSPT